ncbi:uncharacterized protein LOC117317826 isoform X2 [Pecten maximus]|uniref:uncharacterized protein LOC117317826 isoform X2 n=1 Tax=Pecten maximus TaxID=6579 RepID=UPI001458523D|nr:uncharacterized protein LOC117317826 isoform X2 [Pecten maximus]
MFLCDVHMLLSSERAIINCLMDYNGVLAYQPHLDQYESDTGCLTSHLSIWLWAGEPFTCIYQNGTEAGQSGAGKYVSPTEQNMVLPSVPLGEEKHRYICVTNDTMGKRPDLCGPKEIEVRLKEEEMKNLMTTIGCGIGCFLVITVLVLFGLYKRRTRERTTSYLPDKSSRNEMETKTSTCNCESKVFKDENDHHYTLPRTAWLKNVTLVRPALRSMGDVRAGASEGNLHPLRYKYSTRSHRALSPKTSMSAPDLHIYENLEPYMCVTNQDKSCGCSHKKAVYDRNKNSVHEYMEFFTKSGAASAPDIYAELVPCFCAVTHGAQCDCKNDRFKSIDVCQQISAFDKASDIDFHFISKSASAPNLDIGTKVEPDDETDKDLNGCLL